MSKEIIISEINTLIKMYSNASKKKDIHECYKDLLDNELQEGICYAVTCHNFSSRIRDEALSLACSYSMLYISSTPRHLYRYCYQITYSIFINTAITTRIEFLNNLRKELENE